MEKLNPTKIVGILITLGGVVLAGWNLNHSHFTSHGQFLAFWCGLIITFAGGSLTFHPRAFVGNIFFLGSDNVFGSVLLIALTGVTIDILTWLVWYLTALAFGASLPPLVGFVLILVLVIAGLLLALVSLRIATAFIGDES